MSVDALSKLLPPEDGNRFYMKIHFEKLMAMREYTALSTAARGLLFDLYNQAAATWMNGFIWWSSAHVTRDNICRMVKGDQRSDSEKDLCKGWLDELFDAGALALDSKRRVVHVWFILDQQKNDGARRKAIKILMSEDEPPAAPAPQISPNLAPTSGAPGQQVTPTSPQPRHNLVSVSSALSRGAPAIIRDSIVKNENNTEYVVLVGDASQASPPASAGASPAPALPTKTITTPAGDVDFFDRSNDPEQIENSPEQIKAEQSKAKAELLTTTITTGGAGAGEAPALAGGYDKRISVYNFSDPIKAALFVTQDKTGPFPFALKTRFKILESRELFIHCCAEVQSAINDGYTGFDDPRKRPGMLLLKLLDDKIREAGKGHLLDARKNRRKATA